MNAREVLENIRQCINELMSGKSLRTTYRNGGKRFYIENVCEELSIFDWWEPTLSLSQLRQMERFTQTAIKLGFTGYVCFKVGAAGCSHGMWAHTDVSTNGYAPDTGDCLHHSFRSGDNYWDIEIDGDWLSELHREEGKWQFTLNEVKAYIEERRS